MAAVLKSPSWVYRLRPVLVAADLEELHGPATGTVALPLHVFWSSDPIRQWNLDNEVDRREMYRTVVREAKRATDLDVLHGPTLIRIWPDMCSRAMPAPVRDAWEARHPLLAAATQLPAAS